MPQLMEENSKSGTNQNTLIMLSKEIRKKYHTTDTQKLSTFIQRLFRMEAKILKGKYPKPSEFVSIYSLGQAIMDLKESKQFDELLIADEKIKEDNLQFNGEFSNNNDVRRVNFLTAIIMQMRGMQQRDRQIMYTIVQNHNIGKETDEKDNLHGLKGALRLDSYPERLSGFSEEEKDIIKFAIIQHSESDARNQLELERLPLELRPRYKVFLDVLKDAIRLDNIKIDPRVHDVQTRIDILALQTKENKTKLESVAYESYSKIIEVLDLEEEVQSIMQYLRLKKEKSKTSSIEDEDLDRD